MNSYSRILVLLIIVGLWSCGQRGTPNGGPVDETGPVIENSFPENFSTNFKGNSITFKFDEYVKLSNMASEFLISPPIGKPPKFKVKGKKFTVSFDTTFAENTTYSLFFGKGIKDFNANNPLTENQFVFSTGSIIDSLELNGTIIDAFTYLPEKTGYVFLYKNLEDSVPLKQQPSYFSVVKDGFFEFKNIAEGKYKVFALQDDNANYLYDTPLEKIAFIKDDIHVKGKQIDEIKMLSFVGIEHELKIKSKEILKKGELRLTFNKPAIDFKLQSPGIKNENVHLVWNSKKDTLKIYSLDFIDKDSINFITEAKDLKETSFSLDNYKTASVTDNKLSFRAKLKKNTANSYLQPIILSPSIPLKKIINEKGFLLILNGDTNSINKISIKGNNLIIEDKLKPESDYELILLDSTVSSKLEISNKLQKFEFSTFKSGALGNILGKINIDLPGSSFLLEILKDKKIIHSQKITKKEELSLKGLIPGEYEMRIIVDTDKNGTWTPGDYLQKTFSEEVIYYKENLTLRANWDLDFEWNIIP